MNGVASTLNGTLPPAWGTSVTSCPFTNTCARKSTRSKLRIVRKPFRGCAVNVRRYQIWSSGFTFRRTPESGVSTPNGTRIVPSYFAGSSASTDTIASSHVPFSDSHPPRTSCGRGYSRQTFSGVTARPHTVVRSLVEIDFSVSAAVLAAIDRTKNPAGRKTLVIDFIAIF